MTQCPLLYLPLKTVFLNADTSGRMAREKSSQDGRLPLHDFPSRQSISKDMPQVPEECENRVSPKPANPLLTSFPPKTHELRQPSITWTWDTSWSFTYEGQKTLMLPPCFFIVVRERRKDMTIIWRLSKWISDFLWMSYDLSIFHYSSKFIKSQPSAKHPVEIIFIHLWDFMEPLKPSDWMQLSAKHQSLLSWLLRSHLWMDRALHWSHPQWNAYRGNKSKLLLSSN